MKIKQSLPLLIIMLMFEAGLPAQTGPVAAGVTAIVPGDSLKQDPHFANMFKINLLALPLRTITIQYERVVSKFLSVALTGRYMPDATMPYKNWVYNSLGIDDPDFKESLDKMLIGNYAVTPEIRFYLGKNGYGRGFYLAPAFRYAQFTIKNLEYTYLVDNDIEKNLNLNGKMKARYGGLMIGANWALGKRFILDWWIFAPFIGAERTSLTGIIPETLSAEEQELLKESLESIDIPYTTVTASVDNNGATLQLRGLVAAISTGLAFGFRF